MWTCIIRLIIVPSVPVWASAGCDKKVCFNVYITLINNDISSSLPLSLYVCLKSPSLSASDTSWRESDCEGSWNDWNSQNIEQSGRAPSMGQSFFILFLFFKDVNLQFLNDSVDPVYSDVLGHTQSHTFSISVTMTSVPHSEIRTRDM